MRSSKTLKKIRAGKSARMCVLGHYVPAYVTMAARCGYDCIWLDLEHRLIDDREVQALLAYSHLADIDILIRTPTTDKTKLYRYLEDGAAGLMVPHVSTPEKARAMVEASKFPPIGDRGMDGVGLDADFNLEQDQDEYGRHANSETFLVVQIETPQAVEHVEEIAAIEGVDCLFFGPGDFGFRVRNTETDLTIDSAWERVLAAGKKNGKFVGRPAPTLETLKTFTDQGAQFLAHGSEFAALKSMLESCSAEYDEVLGEEG
ncbi:MAG: 4-hydroxy-2-oxovalerate aldolase [Candidatus Omnitrophica bacterium]|nr:4-hydroxy-2-oxovalerate aldolase [Candidatus Omnitrophota bacterium]